GERNAERVARVAAGLLLGKTLRAAVLLAAVAVDAVVDFAAHLAGRRAWIAQFEPVAAALVLGEAFYLVRFGPAQRHELLEVERARQSQERPSMRPVAALRMDRSGEAPAVEQVEETLRQPGRPGAQLARPLGLLAAIVEAARHRLAKRAELLRCLVRVEESVDHERERELQIVRRLRSARIARCRGGEERLD